MSKIKIALDFDSVLSDTMVSWVNNYNKRYRTSYTKQDVRKWAFWDDFGITHNEAVEIFKESWADWEKLQPTENNLSQTTAKLNELGIIDIVSNVENSHTGFIKEWLEKHKIKYNEFLHANNKKEDLEHDVFIDDDPSLPEKLSKNNKKCLLYHQEWNKTIQSGNVTRINHLAEAFGILKN